MKIRTGFVSNSSSSSFLIWGACMSASDLRALLALDEDAELDSVLYDRFKGTELEEYCPMGDSSYFLGISWDKVKDDETGAQFKARVQRELTKLLGKEVPCATHEDAWYNG